MGNRFSTNWSRCYHLTSAALVCKCCKNAALYNDGFFPVSCTFTEPDFRNISLQWTFHSSTCNYFFLNLVWTNYFLNKFTKSKAVYINELFIKLFLINFKKYKYEELLLRIVWPYRIHNLWTYFHSRRTEEWGSPSCLWQHCLDSSLFFMDSSNPFSTKILGINSFTFIREIFGAIKKGMHLCRK